MKSTEQINVERFDAYLKKVFGNEVKSYYLRLSKQREKYVIFSNMSISEEKEEQARLRKKYIEEFKMSLRGQLENIEIVD